MTLTLADILVHREQESHSQAAPEFLSALQKLLGETHIDFFFFKLLYVGAMYGAMYDAAKDK